MTTCEARACSRPAVARVTVQLPGWRTPETRAVCAEHHRQLVPPTLAPVQSAPPAPALAPETKEAPVATKKKWCCMPGCGNQPKAKWLCQTHYRHLSLFPDIAAKWPTVPEGKPTQEDIAALEDAWQKRDTSSPVVEPPEASKAAREAAAKLATEHERLRGEHEALAAERDQLATEHEALTAELKQAHEDVDTITRLVTDLAVRLVGPQAETLTTSHQLRGIDTLVKHLRADLSAERAGWSRLGPEKSQRDPDGPGLVDPTAALLLLDFARDLAGELDGELARAVYHAIGGALGALREQMPDVRR